MGTRVRIRVWTLRTDHIGQLQVRMGAIGVKFCISQSQIDPILVDTAFE